MLVEMIEAASVIATNKKEWSAVARWLSDRQYPFSRFRRYFFISKCHKQQPQNPC